MEKEKNSYNRKKGQKNGRSAQKKELYKEQYLCLKVKNVKKMN